MVQTDLLATYFQGWGMDHRRIEWPELIQPATTVTLNCNLSDEAQCRLTRDRLDHALLTLYDEETMAAINGRFMQDVRCMVDEHGLLQVELGPEDTKPLSDQSKGRHVVLLDLAWDQGKSGGFTEVVLTIGSKYRHA